MLSGIAGRMLYDDAAKNGREELIKAEFLPVC